MKQSWGPIFALAMAAFAGSWLAMAQQSARQAAKVDQNALKNAAKNSSEWLTYGRDQAETRYSPLKQINDQNVSKLGLATVWPLTALGAMESTPLVSGGVLYATASYGVTFAYDLRTKERLWQYDPEVAFEVQQRACCGVVNRGAAIYNGRVYVAALDGRLIALNAATGKVDWEVQTTPKDEWYTITMAPRVVKGKVLIGNGGAEYAVRGFITAYDAETGKQAWRFYTIPGDPSKPFENPELKEAAKTWTGEWWKMGGGGTVWDTFAYDADLDLLYVGTGNGGPWNRDLRSPQGGDNLYLSSILALKPDTGRLQWHYQVTPGDTWDYTAVQGITLADVRIGGQMRKILMQAPKNGFFYVLDRTNGKLISAEAYGQVNWAKGIDLKTGRPIENEGARYGNGSSVRIMPGPGGAHNWHAQSWNPNTGLLYIPGLYSSSNYSSPPNYEFAKGRWNTGVSGKQPTVPNLPAIGPTPAQGQGGFLAAWDPATQKERWRINFQGGFNQGGTMTTAGNLVFHGETDGRFAAYSADKGDKLWEMPLGIVGMANPITYEMDGQQYIAVLGGRATNPAAGLAKGAGEAGKNQNGPGPKLFIFALDGKKSVEEALPKQ